MVGDAHQHLMPIEAAMRLAEFRVAIFDAVRDVGGQVALGAVELVTTDPDARLVVEVRDDQVVVHDGPVPDGARSVTMDAVTLLELLSRRDVGVEEPPEVAWLAAGLAEVFDQTGG